jgi:hypothetical protein
LLLQELHHQAVGFPSILDQLTPVVKAFAVETDDFLWSVIALESKLDVVDGIGKLERL